MNQEKVQVIINQEIEDFQKSIRYSRQHDVAKWQVAKLEELGILDLMPKGFKHGDAGHIIKLAEEKQIFVSNYDDAHEVTSALYDALEETEEEPESIEIKKGDIVTVLPHTEYQHLYQGAIITPPIEHLHTGYKSVKVTDKIEMSPGEVAIQVRVPGGYELIPIEYIEKN